MIELLAVIFIIMILAAMVLSIAQYAMTKGKIARANSQIHEMQNELLEYQLRQGVYPDSITAVVANLPEGSGFDYLDNSGSTHIIPLDPWDREYVYEKNSSRSYSIYSHGPKTNITADDISGGG